MVQEVAKLISGPDVDVFAESVNTRQVMLVLATSSNDILLLSLFAALSASLFALLPLQVGM